jgi:hypothetical protein
VNIAERLKLLSNNKNAPSEPSDELDAEIVKQTKQIDFAELRRHLDESTGDFRARHRASQERPRLEISV